MPDEDQTQPETVEFDSSLVVSATYAETDHSLTVTLANGRVYTYTDIGPEEWAQMKEAPSTGRWFNANLRGRY